jgi:hypothetical protein
MVGISAFLVLTWFSVFATSFPSDSLTQSLSGTSDGFAQKSRPFERFDSDRPLQLIKPSTNQRQANKRHGLDGFALSSSRYQFELVSRSSFSNQIANSILSHFFVSPHNKAPPIS